MSHYRGMTSPIVQRCFPPVVKAETRLLVLGSLPGEVSLARRQYYAHPRNHFWRLMGRVTDRDLETLPYEDRLSALIETGVGVWDTVAAGTRAGSLDSAIRLREASDLSSLAAGLPNLRAIAFNGGKAARIGRRQFPESGGPDLIDLPSSSPANALPFERKLEAWMVLREYLRG